MVDDVSFWQYFGSFWIICGFLAGYLYARRGRSLLVGFLGGFLLGPLGIVLAFVAPDARAARERQTK